LEGTIFCYGKLGSGKSVALKSVVESYHNLGYKIFDVYGGERHEGVYWCLPSQDIEYWNKMESLFGPFDESAPKQYNVNLLYPYFESKLPKKLPKKVPFVKSQLFTIPLKDIEITDIKLVIGSVSEQGNYFWEEIKQMIKKEDNCGSLDFYAKKVKSINSILYKNFILPMSREKFLGSQNADTNINIIEEFRDKKTITVLCLEFVPDRFKLFVINYILRKIKELIDLNKIGKKNIQLFREVSNFLKSPNETTDQRKVIFRDLLSDCIRMGRRGAYFCCDTQSASELKGVVAGQEDYILVFRMTSYRDKMEIFEEPKRERRITNLQIGDLAFLNPGQCYCLESGHVARKVQIVLPRSAYWKKEYGNFYKNMWEKHGGEWQFTEETKEYINKKFNEKIEEYQKKYKEVVKTSKKEINDISEDEIVEPINDVFEEKIIKEKVIEEPYFPPFE
jgi:hypothetical protein